VRFLCEQCELPFDVSFCECVSPMTSGKKKTMGREVGALCVDSCVCLVVELEVGDLVGRGARGLLESRNGC